MTAFDPAAWLRSFERAGGWYAIAPDGRMSIGYPLDAQGACRLAKDLDANEVACAAVRRAIRDRERRGRRYG